MIVQINLTETVQIRHIVERSRQFNRCVGAAANDIENKAKNKVEAQKRENTKRTTLSCSPHQTQRNEDDNRTNDYSPGPLQITFKSINFFKCGCSERHCFIEVGYQLKNKRILSIYAYK